MKSNLKIEIPSGANEIIHTLQNNGYEAFLVGGCVRDSILGRPIHDYDITTSATPDEMMEVFKDKRIIETGLQHGTITILIDGEGYECTTYRIDGNYSDNGKDVMDTMLIKSGKDVGYWLNEILTRVIDGRLKNDREDLIYWMTGITDGWIKY